MGVRSTEAPSWFRDKVLVHVHGPDLDLDLDLSPPHCTILFHHRPWIPCNLLNLAPDCLLFFGTLIHFC